MTVSRSERDRQQGKAAQAVPVSARLRAYWQGLRVGTTLPRRDQIEPRALSPLLGAVCLVDWTEHGAARLRVAGQVFARLYGMELHGAPLALLFEPSERTGIGHMVRTVCEGPCAVDLGLRSDGGAGRPSVTARMMLLPLLDRNGGRTLAIGSLEVTGDVGRAPRRFKVERCLRTGLGVD